MKNYRKNILIGAFAVVVISGCASTPENIDEVEKVRAEYKLIESDQEIVQYAPVALDIAEEELEKLDAMVEDNAKEKAIDQQIYIIQRKIDIAKANALAKKSEASVAAAELRRKDLLLAAKTQEANEARLRAEANAARAEKAEQYAQQMEQRADELKNKMENISAEKTERGLVLTLSNILFETNEAVLKSGADRTMQQIANFLNEYPERKVVVEGFTDSIGGADYNLDLSQKRAETVNLTLQKYGVSFKRIRSLGYGESYPVASNDNASGRQQNRRVEIIIANAEGTDIQGR